MIQVIFINKKKVKTKEGKELYIYKFMYNNDLFDVISNVDKHYELGKVVELGIDYKVYNNKLGLKITL